MVIWHGLHTELPVKLVRALAIHSALLLFANSPVLCKQRKAPYSYPSLRAFKGFLPFFKAFLMGSYPFLKGLFYVFLSF